MNRLNKQIAMQQPTVLLVAEESAERTQLQAILQEANCRVLLCARGRDALELVEFASVVICEAPLPDCSWHDILHRTQESTRPPSMIVTSRQTSGNLWAEALNLGVFDVLAQPICADETLRVVRSAHRRYTLPGASELSSGPTELKGRTTAHAF